MVGDKAWITGQSNGVEIRALYGPVLQSHNRETIPFLDPIYVYNILVTICLNIFPYQRHSIGKFL